MSLREVGLKKYSSLVDTAFMVWYEGGGGGLCTGEQRSGGERHRRNKPRTIQKQRGNAHSFPFPWKGRQYSQCVLLLQEALPTTVRRKWQPVVPFTHIKSSSPQPHTSSNVSNILKNPRVAPARTAYSVSKSNHGCLFTTLPKTIGKKTTTFKNYQRSSVFSDSVISLY